jgi:hypothetical protein
MNNIGSMKSNEELSGKIEDVVRKLSSERQALVKLDQQYRRQIISKGGVISRAANILICSLPFVSEKFAKQTSPLRQIADNMFRAIQRVQAALGMLAEVAVQKGVDIKTVEKDLERANAENWDVRTLRNYFFGRVGLNNNIVDDLADRELELLTEEQLKAKRQELIQVMGAHIQGGIALIQVLAHIAETGIEILEKGVIQYWSLKTIIAPVEAVRAAAEGFATTNLISHQAKDIVQDYLAQSVHGIEICMDAVMLFHEYAIDSPQTVAMFQEQYTRLRSKLELLYQKEESKQLQACPDIISSLPVTDLRKITTKEVSQDAEKIFH